jgi:hypothetical protein
MRWDNVMAVDVVVVAVITDALTWLWGDGVWAVVQKQRGRTRL